MRIVYKSAMERVDSICRNAVNGEEVDFSIILGMNDFRIRRAGHFIRIKGELNSLRVVQGNT